MFETRNSPVFYWLVIRIDCRFQKVMKNNKDLFRTQSPVRHSLTIVSCFMQEMHVEQEQQCMSSWDELVHHVIPVLPFWEAKAEQRGSADRRCCCSSFCRTDRDTSRFIGTRKTCLPVCHNPRPSNADVKGTPSLIRGYERVCEREESCYDARGRRERYPSENAVCVTIESVWSRPDIPHLLHKSEGTIDFQLISLPLEMTACLFLMSLSLLSALCYRLNGMHPSSRSSVIFI